MRPTYQDPPPKDIAEAREAAEAYIKDGAATSEIQRYMIPATYERVVINAFLAGWYAEKRKKKNG